MPTSPNQALVDQYLTTSLAFTDTESLIDEFQRRVDYQQWCAQEPGCLGIFSYAQLKLLSQDPIEMTKLQVFIDRFSRKSARELYMTAAHVDISLRIQNVFSRKIFYGYFATDNVRAEDADVKIRQSTLNYEVIGVVLEFSFASNARAFKDYEGFREHMLKQHYESLKKRFEGTKDTVDIII